MIESETQSYFGMSLTINFKHLTKDINHFCVKSNNASPSTSENIKLELSLEL